MIRAVLALLLALAPPAFAAMEYNVADGQHFRLNAVEVSMPFTICAWARPENDTNANTAVSIGISGGGVTNVLTLNFAGPAAGDPVRAQSIVNAVTVQATTTTGFTVGTWHHACAVFTSTTSRAAYIDGGSKGTDTTSSSPTGMNRTLVGAAQLQAGPSNYFHGGIAEVGIWSEALTDDDVRQLGLGFAPPCVKPATLEMYTRGIREGTGLVDIYRDPREFIPQGSPGTPVAAAHPPQIINCQ
jgi:hypothetical protein